MPPISSFIKTLSLDSVTERGLEVHRSLYYVKQIPVESGLERKDFFIKSLSYVTVLTSYFAKLVFVKCRRLHTLYSIGYRRHFCFMSKLYCFLRGS